MFSVVWADSKEVKDLSSFLKDEQGMMTISIGSFFKDEQGMITISIGSFFKDDQGMITISIGSCDVYEMVLDRAMPPP